MPTKTLSTGSVSCSPIRGRSACAAGVDGAVRGASLFHRGSLKIFRWTLPVPPFRLTLYQIAIASADMLVAGSVLYALFPPIHGGYLTVLESTWWSTC